jgi:hypothetical protein
MGYKRPMNHTIVAEGPIVAARDEDLNLVRLAYSVEEAFVLSISIG